LRGGITSFLLEVLIKRIWREVIKMYLIDDPLIAWDGILKWGIKELKAVLCKLSWGATVYKLWRQMNDLKFGN
jgi:hypothetical protein